MIDRRGFIAGAAAGAAALALDPRTAGAARTPRVAQFTLEELTIAQLQQRMASGELTARQVAQLYLERIEAIDRSGPRLRSVIEVNPEALAIAERLDGERRAGRVRGPLHGVPVLLKDNIDTGDRMLTSAGSLALADAPAARDAYLVQRLRAAGAVILGKTNLSEWANFRSMRSSSGWSARGGQCRNPYVLDRSPCGSSSGSGAAIAANLAMVAVGTETDGSVVCPANANGVVGIKPTVGLVSRSGIVPISHNQDTAGPMARTVTDAALLLAALAGADPEDAATRGAPAAADYVRALDEGALRGARIGVARAKFFGYSPETDALAEQALAALREAGATLIDPADIPHAGEYDDSEFEVLLHDFKHDLAAYLRRRGPTARPKTLADLIRFNEEHREQELRWFGQEIFAMADAKGPLTDPAYVEALAKSQRLARTEGLDAVLREHRLDAIVAPTGSPAWPIDLVNGDHFLGGSSSPAAVSGYPGLSIPIGYAHALPVGISFIGGAWSEARLIGLAYALEQALNARRKPEFLASVPLE